MQALKKWNSHIVELISGASINFLAKILATLLGLISSLLLTRTYGTNTVGTIATITSIITIGTIFALSGFGTLTLKLIPTSLANLGAKLTRNLYLKLLYINTFHSLIACLVVFLLISKTPLAKTLDLQVNLALPGILIVFATLLTISSNTLRCLGDYIKYSALDFFSSLLVLSIIVGSILTNSTSHFMIHAYFIAHVAACLLAFGLVIKHFHSCLLYTSPSPRDATLSRMPSSA